MHHHTKIAYKSLDKARTHRNTDRRTDGHGDSIIDPPPLPPRPASLFRGSNINNQLEANGLDLMDNRTTRGSNKRRNISGQEQINGTVDPRPQRQGQL